MISAAPVGGFATPGPGTSVTGEGLADMVLATFSAETAAQIMRSVLQQTTRGHMCHG
jgi:hypothetical protein